MSRWLKATRVVGVLALLILHPPGAKALDTNYFVVDDVTFGATTIDFETGADGAALTSPKLFEDATPLKDEYASMGIHFAGARGSGGGCILHQDSDFGINARSGVNILAFNREAETNDSQTPSEPEIISFDTPVANLSLYAAGGFTTESFRLDAYDAAGNLADSATVTGQDYQSLSVSSSGGIARAILSRNGARASAVLSIPNVSATPGATVTIPIQVDAGALNVAAIHLKLTFGDVLTVTDPSWVAPGPLFLNGLEQANLSTPGEVAVSAASEQGTNGPGVALTIQATVRSDAAPGNYPLQLADAQLSDVFGQAIQASVADGALTVTNPPPAVTCGDYDGNGQLSIRDVTLALQFVVGLKTPTDAQNPASCGYALNIGYVTRLLRAVVGLTDPPAPQGGG